MGHSCKIHDKGFSRDILSQSKREFRFESPEGIGIDNLFEIDGLSVGVGNFNAYNSLPRDGGDDTDGQSAQGERQVICQVDNPADFYSGSGLKLIDRDHRSGSDLDHLPLHAVIQKFFL